VSIVVYSLVVHFVIISVHMIWDTVKFNNCLLFLFNVSNHTNPSTAMCILFIFCCLSCYRELGIDTLSKCENEMQEFFRLAQTMFDTKLPPGVAMLQPFSEGSSIKKISVEVSSIQ